MPYQVFFIYYLLCFVEGIIIFLFIYECSIKLFNCSQSKKKKKNFNQGAFIYFHIDFFITCFFVKDIIVFFT